jgi:ferredoxin-NADP reductase
MKLVGNIVEKKRITEDLYFVRIKPPSPLIFIPGQFMSIEVGEGIRRSYSMSNLPGEENLETYVDCSPMGPGSRYFLSAKTGDEIKLLVPLGQFLYTEQSSPVHFFATGTGIVPFISMIRYALEVLHTKRKITLHLGARTIDELICNELWKSYVDRFDNFQYLPHVTRSSSWMGNIPGY